MKTAKKGRGRPKKDDRERKIGISAKFSPALVTRIKKRAKLESRSSNSIMEIILDKNV